MALERGGVNMAFQESSVKRSETGIRWTLAAIGIVALILDLGRSHLEPSYARLAHFALPVWSMLVGLVVFFMPPVQELWTEKTVKRTGLLWFALGLLDFISTFVYWKA